MDLNCTVVIFSHHKIVLKDGIKHQIVDSPQTIIKQIRINITFRLSIFALETAIGNILQEAIAGAEYAASSSRKLRGACTVTASFPLGFSTYVFVVSIALLLSFPIRQHYSLFNDYSQHRGCFIR